MTGSQLPLQNAFDRWLLAWERYDLEGVLAFCHRDILFEHWTGAQVHGKAQLRRAWHAWFAKPQGFRFIPEAVWIADDMKTGIFRWVLEWPSPEKDYLGRSERRRGMDILAFEEGLIIEKLTYCKSVVEIDGRFIPLQAESVTS